MITREEYVDIKPNILEYFSLAIADFSNVAPEDYLFFDIETTGLKASTSFLYLIGCMRIEQGRFVLRQFLAEDLSEEALLIDSFLKLTNKNTRLVHFNGDTFDVPYLTQKETAFNILPLVSSFASIDLYGLLRGFRNFLGLSSMRQKSVESFLGVPRKDEKDGGELIEVYRDFLVARKLRKDDVSAELLGLLLLHNHDDVIGLARILPVLFAKALRSGCFEVAGCELVEGSNAYLRMLLNLGFPSPVESVRTGKPYPAESDASSALKVSGDEACLLVPVYCGELKLFFENTKDYYYLPGEDRAIHKSLAAFIDKSLKERAKASNCYEKRAGSYLPAPKGLFAHELCFAKKDRLVFVPADELASCKDFALLKAYASFFIRDGFF